jgi:hypothetical protein
VDSNQKENKMTTEQQTPPVEIGKETKAPEATTITVDLNGKNYEVPIELGKDLIAFRDEFKKIKSLKEKTEAEVKAEKQKSQLLEAMKSQDIESVKSQVAQEYVEKIKLYEDKIFKNEVKSLLAAESVLPEALDDAVALATLNASFSLKDNEVMIGEKKAKEYVQEFVKTKPHLKSIQVAQKKPQEKQGTLPKTNNGEFQKFAQGLFKK